MVFQFDRETDLHTSTRRVVAEECALIREKLTSVGQENIDQSVHESRKAFKRLRSLLRLARPALGEHDFDRADQLVRAFGKRLAAPRDAFVLIRTWDRVVAGMEDPMPLEDLELPRKVRGILVTHYLEAIDETFRNANEPHRVAQELETLEELIAAAHLWQFGERELRESLKAQVDRCRQRWKKVKRKASEQSLHRLRREAKYVMHQLELAAAFLDKCDQRLIKQLGKLVDALGEDHDLAVLREIMDSEVATIARRDDMETIDRQIRQGQKRLTKKAMGVGGRVFCRKAEVFKAR